MPVLLCGQERGESCSESYDTADITQEKFLLYYIRHGCTHGRSGKPFGNETPSEYAVYILLVVVVYNTMLQRPSQKYMRRQLFSNAHGS